MSVINNGATGSTGATGSRGAPVVRSINNIQPTINSYINNLSTKYEKLNSNYKNVQSSIEQIQNAIQTKSLDFSRITAPNITTWCNYLFDQTIKNFDESWLPELSSFINDIDRMITISIEQRKNDKNIDELFAKYLQNLTNPVNLSFRKDEICVEILSLIYNAVNAINNLNMNPKELYDSYITAYNKAEEYYEKLKNTHLSQEKKLQFLQLYLEKMTELESINIEMCDRYFQIYIYISRIWLLKLILRELLGDLLFEQNYKPLINNKLNEDLFIISLFIMNSHFDWFFNTGNKGVFFIGSENYLDTIYKRTLESIDANKAATTAEAEAATTVRAAATAATTAATAAATAATAATAKKNKVELIIQSGESSINASESSINATIKAAACPAAKIASALVQNIVDSARKNPHDAKTVASAALAVAVAVETSQATATAAKSAAEAALKSSTETNKLVLLEKTTAIADATTKLIMKRKAKEAAAAAKEAMSATPALTSYIEATTHDDRFAALRLSIIAVMDTLSIVAALVTLSIVAAQLAAKVANTNGLFINGLQTATYEQFSLVQLINNICNQINAFLLKDDILTTGISADNSNIIIDYKLLLECVITRLSITMIDNFIKLDINNNPDYNDIDSICNKSILTYIDGHYKKAKKTYDTYQGSYDHSLPFTEDYSINSSIREINQREMIDSVMFPNKTKSLKQLEEMETKGGIVGKGVMTATGIKRKTPEEIEEILEKELVKLVMSLLNQYFLTNYYTTIQDIEQFVQSKLESRLQPYIIKRAIMKLYYKQDPNKLEKTYTPLLKNKLYLIIESFIRQTTLLFTDKISFLDKEKKKIESEKSRAFKSYLIYSGSFDKSSLGTYIKPNDEQLEQLAKKLNISAIYDRTVAMGRPAELIRQLNDPTSDLYTKDKDLIKEIKRLVKKLIIQKISDTLIAAIETKKTEIEELSTIFFTEPYQQYDDGKDVKVFDDFQTAITTYLSNFKRIGFQQSLIPNKLPIDVPNKQKLCSDVQSVYRLLGTTFYAPTQLPLLMGANNLDS